MQGAGRTSHSTGGHTKIVRVNSEAMELIRAIEPIGRGHFSVVYRCETKEGEFALKVIPKAEVRDPEDKERLQREIDALSLLEHPNLIHLHAAFCDESNFYLMLDLCEGGELQKVLDAKIRFTEDESRLVFSQVVAAIDFLHCHSIAHRDLKPQNILVSTFPHIKVCDLGLCESMVDGKPIDNFCGSPCYCSPECLFRIKYDGRISDIWSLGVLLYTMVVGDTPWSTTNQQIMLRKIMKAEFEIPDFVSPECADLIRKMITLDPNSRISLDGIIKHQWMGSHVRRTTKSSSLEDLVAKNANRKTVCEMGIKLPVIGEETARRRVEFVNGAPPVTCRSKTNCVCAEKPQAINTCHRRTISMGCKLRRHPVIPQKSRRPTGE